METRRISRDEPTYQLRRPTVARRQHQRQRQHQHQHQRQRQRLRQLPEPEGCLHRRVEMAQVRRSAGSWHCGRRAPVMVGARRLTVGRPDIERRVRYVALGRIGGRCAVPLAHAGHHRRLDKYPPCRRSARECGSGEGQQRSAAGRRGAGGVHANSLPSRSTSVALVSSRASAAPTCRTGRDHQTSAPGGRCCPFARTSVRGASSKEASLLARRRGMMVGRVSRRRCRRRCHTTWQVVFWFGR